MAKCMRCGRKLTNPDSIAIGIGRECLNKHGNVSKSQAKWQRRMVRTARAKFGNGISIGSHVISKDNFHVHQEYLEKYKWIVKDEDVSDELLLKVYEDPSQYLNEEDTN